jgi:cytochrome c biogenesis protein CcmG/thiol:disulfide interchange protein DsbE
MAERRDGFAMTRRRKWSLLLGGVAVALVVAAIAVGASLPQATDYQAASPLLGRPAPEFEGTTINGGKQLSLASLRGRFVVVNFFASWCVPCEEEAPYLEQFAYAESAGAEVVGVVFEDVLSTAANFVRQTGATYPVIADPGERIAISYGVKGPPATFVISPTGVVAAYVSGPVTDTGLESLIGRLSEGRR